MNSSVPRRKRIRVLSSSSEEDEPSRIVDADESFDTTVSDISQLTCVMKDVVRAMELQTNNHRASSRVFHTQDNVIPIFNPENQDLHIEQWCQRIDELKNLYNWSDEVVVFNAITKLQGLAKVWYNSLPTIKHNWEE